MASSDPYRDYLTEEDINNTQWNFGPPNYDVVNKLFEDGRTYEWAVGSVEEKVQRLVKTFEMELVHKGNPDQFKTLDPNKFTISINGRTPLNLLEVKETGGSYNVFLQTSLPVDLQIFVPSAETTETSKAVFETTFARGFAFEVLEVYSGPPKIAYKFRHWGYMDGPYKGHAPTGEKCEFYGSAIFELGEDERVVKVQFFYDRGELLSGFLKGKLIDEQGNSTSSTSACPFMS
ncbi:hypothetical protein Leryth_014689 [Lithospermum erythrorhizon]|nr:hypothetical protein Leryth_014689 [Lithospermum erythrorhizon]